MRLLNILLRFFGGGCWLVGIADADDMSLSRLRGNLKTNQVVKDFWVKCKGTFA